MFPSYWTLMVISYFMIDMMGCSPTSQHWVKKDLELWRLAEALRFLLQCLQDSISISASYFGEEVNFSFVADLDTIILNISIIWTDSFVPFMVHRVWVGYACLNWSS